MENYYKELPEDFEKDLVIDAKDIKFGIIFNLVALVLMVGCYVLGIYFKLGSIDLDFTYTSLLIACGITILYMIVHELTHGAAYKIITKQKLTFGISFSCAFCGLKEGYFSKKCGLIAILAPFVIHSIWMILLLIFLPYGQWFYIILFVFSAHFGGCVGDLFGALIMIFKYHHKELLINDTGPKQTFYVKK
ncbi:MAG: DUF3267 domain-containing protein [Anaeroplasmataceae bacterium]|nr:DUF3267 domain-containing protein [Anaeroplasmataceae bacterium]MDE6013841.1 DUF3267 domain-containing protein [Anaeroplasmataceae bacterium]